MKNQNNSTQTNIFIKINKQKKKSRSDFQFLIPSKLKQKQKKKYFTKYSLNCCYCCTRKLHKFIINYYFYPMEIFLLQFNVTSYIPWYG